MAFMSVFLMGIVFFSALFGLLCAIIALGLFVIYKKRNKSKKILIPMIILTVISILAISPLVFFLIFATILQWVS